MKGISKGNHKNGEIEITKEKLVFENQFLRAYNDEVIFPSGVEGTYFRTGTQSNLCVGVLPITEHGELIMIKTYRHAARGWGYEMPKGGVLPDEDTEQAALRELEEETGFTAEKLKYVGEWYESPSICSVKMKCYIALGCRKTSEQNCELTEAISGVEIIRSEDILSKCGELDFCDAMTELILYRYILEGRAHSGEI